MVHKSLTDALGWLGMAAALGMYSSPVLVSRIIIKNKDVQKYSPTVYSFSLLNCALWLVYAIITPNRMQLMITNVVGIALQIAFISIFFFYAKPLGRKVLSKQIAVAVLFFVCSLATTIWLAPRLTFLQKQSPDLSLRSIFLGWICVVINVLMFASPLSILRLVLVTKSSHYLSKSIALGTLWCAGTWLSYAFCVSDTNLMIPNGLGVLLAFAQIALWYMYRTQPSHNPADDSGTDTTNSTHTDGGKQLKIAILQ
eukprot:c6064_g1_i2.p1 GENE.c6064_g1_i2~~c6064_g1_i2.p1  ORF type:complete len:255 (-),score=36.11 c6064_g1_i2:204-968(-)